jgi:tripartite-type tricarboxylate transporter receptor subunit TctC
MSRQPKTLTVAYTDFDRPFASAPGVPPERVEILREAFGKMLADAGFLTEAQKLVDWDGASYLSGADLQKKIDKTASQPPEVIKHIKEILNQNNEDLSKIRV